MRSAVVVNPAKVTDMPARREQICAALADAGWPEPLWLETTVDDPGCGQTRQALAARVEVLFACGGDGTVMACATELAGTEVALAVLPAGTGNLLAANLDLPSDVEKAVALAIGPGRRRIDVGALDGRCFTVMAGIGFDADMLDATSDVLKKWIGWPAYVLGALRSLRKRRMRLRIRLDDGAPMYRRARTVLVANVGKLQGGIDLFPDASPDDGVFDIAVITPGYLTDWLALGWDVLRHRPHQRHLQIFRAARVEILSNRSEQREVDGDLIEPGRELLVTARPKALLLCVP